MPMILRAAFLPLLFLATPPTTTEPACRLAIVADASSETIRFTDGDVFLPDNPFDALEISPGDVMFACEDHLRESEGLFPIFGRWADREM